MSSTSASVSLIAASAFSQTNVVLGSSGDLGVDLLFMSLSVAAHYCKAGGKVIPLQTQSIIATVTVSGIVDYQKCPLLVFLIDELGEFTQSLLLCLTDVERCMPDFEAIGIAKDFA